MTMVAEQERPGEFAARPGVRTARHFGSIELKPSNGCFIYSS